MSSHPSLATFVLGLFDLARLGLGADVERLAGRLGVEPALARRALAELDRRGFVDAERVRLTLLGLALASSLERERARGLVAPQALPAANERHAPGRAA